MSSSSNNDVPHKNVTVFHAKGNTTSIANFHDFIPIGKGSFGVVYSAIHRETGAKVAIKKVVQDSKYMNRELPVMKELDHPNIVKLLYYFMVEGEGSQTFLYLVLECLPSTVFKVVQHYAHVKKTLPVIYIKLYMYQLYRALAYLHWKHICHRDVKPNNMLVDLDTGVMKLCDLGSAKKLVDGEANVSYICSRFYRAPELVFGATHYTCSIDMWSAACVHCELYTGEPLFPGESGVDQLVEIIRILGTPKPDEILAMNPHYKQCSFPSVRKKEITACLKCETDGSLSDLLNHILVYRPMDRITAYEACSHPYFEYLFSADCRLPNGKILPPLFNFSAEELRALEGLEPSRRQLLLTQSSKAAASSSSDPMACDTNN